MMVTKVVRVYGGRMAQGDWEKGGRPIPEFRGHHLYAVKQGRTTIGWLSHTPPGRINSGWEYSYDGSLFHRAASKREAEGAVKKRQARPRAVSPNRGTRIALCPGPAR